jgi:hypothetical protein
METNSFDDDYYNVDLIVKYRDSERDLMKDIEEREEMEEYIKIRQNYMDTRGYKTVEELHMNLRNDIDLENSDASVVAIIKEKEHEAKLLAIEKSVTKIANSIALSLRKMDLLHIDPTQIKHEITFEKRFNGMVYPVLKDLSKVNLANVQIKDFDDEYGLSETEPIATDPFFDRSDPTKFDENGDYKFTRKDVKMICDKIYRDELLEAFNVKTIHDIAPRMRAVTRKIAKDKKFHSTLYETRLILVDIGIEEFKDEDTGEASTPDEMIVFTLFSQKMFYITHKCICELLKNRCVRSDLLADLKSNLIEILRKKD